MSVMALGLNHTSAPLDLRGRFALAAEQLVPTLQAFRQRLAPTQEAAIVSTCNRTELYVSGDAQLAAPALDWLADVGGVSHDTLRAHSYVLEDAAAARHAFSVASGLDSMVIGEPQILGQMKQAMRHAEQAGTLGSTLAPDVPAILRRRQGSAQRHADRRAFGQPGGCGGAPGGAIVRRPGPHQGAVHRRRRDDRPGRGALRLAQAAGHGGGESQR